jgi:hypothetical protein
VNFAGYFAAKSLEPEIKKRLFGRKEVLFGNYIATYQTVFYFGCALGVTFKNHKESALRLYSRPGNEEGLLKSCSINVSSVQEICDAERDRIISVIHKNRAQPKALDEIWNTPMPAEQASDLIAWAFVYGTVLGSQNPEVVERTWPVEGRPSLEEAKRTSKALLREWLTNNKIPHDFLTDYFNTENV